MGRENEIHTLLGGGWGGGSGGWGKQQREKVWFAFFSPQ